MKTFNFLSAIILVAVSFTSNAQVKSENIKVWGNCGMCQTRIEKAAKDAGASVAKWDHETGLLTVAYNSSKNSLVNIEQKIASVGHDTKSVRANDEAYSRLHSCCKYERNTAAASTTIACCNHKEKCMVDGVCTMKGSAACKMKSGEECKTVDGKSCCSKS